MSFADEVKRWVSPRSVGGQMALLLVVTSIIAAASRPVMEQLLLNPADVLQQFKLWQAGNSAFAIFPGINQRRVNAQQPGAVFDTPQGTNAGITQQDAEHFAA